MSRPIHFEILAQDPTRANEFYKNALGWEINPWEMPGSTYWLVRTGKGNRGIDGAIMQPGDLRQAVINTIEVVSLDESRNRIEAAGGRLVQGPNDIPNVGMHAYFADPEGTLFGILQPPPGSQAMQQEDAPAKRRRRSAPVRKRAASRKPAARKAPARKAGAARKAAARPTAAKRSKAKTTRGRAKTARAPAKRGGRTRK